MRTCVTAFSASSAVRLMISYRVPIRPQRTTSQPPAFARPTNAVPTGLASVPPPKPAPDTRDPASRYRHTRKRVL